MSEAVEILKTIGAILFALTWVILMVYVGTHKDRPKNGQDDDDGI